MTTTEPEIFFDCGIPGHPQPYAHQHLGGWRDCVECQDFVSQGLRSGALMGACASVGIEHGMSTAETLEHYMIRMHDGHAASSPAV